MQHLAALDTFKGVSLEAISTTLSGTAVAVFVYDTRNDSDGGRAVVNAGLPPLIGIVATATAITLFKGTDTSATTISTISSLSNVTCIFAINGRLYVGSSSAGLLVYDLLNSNQLVMTYTTGSIPAIVANTVQCVTGIVLPTAAIDASKGLPNPVIYCGTLGGVSRIADDGTVSSWTESGSIDDVYNVSITDNYVYWSTTSASTNPIVIVFPIASVLVASLYYSTTYNHYSSLSTATWLSTLTPIQYGGVQSVGRDYTKGSFATDRSLTLIQPNTTTWGNGLHATITKDFNSGWQFGDIRGAWLCNGTAETLTAASLVTGDSSTFTSGVGSWASDNATISASVGELLMNSAGGASGSVQAYLALTTTIGRTYVYAATVRRGTGSDNIKLIAFNSNYSVILGTSDKNTTTSNQLVFLTFTATTTTTYLTICTDTADNSGTYYADNITVKLADPDYSYKNQALEVVGSITKAAVATGCELMAYSGFSASNYLSQAYRSDLDFGTGDFHISFWIYKVANASTDVIFNRQISSLANASNRILVYFAGVDALAFLTYDGAGVASGVTTVSNLSQGVWTKIDLTRVSGLMSIYINAVVNVSTQLTARDLTSSVNSVTIGAMPGVYPTTSKLSKFHISAGAPSAAQIKAAYESEKILFTAGTKCLLAGTSNDVKAVDYDSQTGIHHCVTGDYYNAFKGLARVDSASGVWTSVNAENGLILKGN